MSQGRIEAEEIFDPKDVCKWDPFAGVVESALLNSADIDAYATTLVPPLFSDYDRSGLKPATYEVKFEGDVYWWVNEKSLLDKINPGYEENAFETKLKHKKLGGDDDFEIPPNSIIFVVPKTYFRVPPYLVLRFNLHINLVHRGLLLGTGPLVDPGFAGRLMIPVHNLTSQPMVVRGDRGFIWIEVTKLSKVRYGEIVKEFPKEKNAKSVKQYFNSANGLNPIVSTLLVTSVKLHDLTKWMRTISAYASVIFVMSLLSVLWGGWSLLNDAHGYITGAKNEVQKELATLDVERQNIRVLQEEVAKEITHSQAVVKELVAKNVELEKRLDSLMKAK